jgi:hypothetical protein
MFLNVLRHVSKSICYSVWESSLSIHFKFKLEYMCCFMYIVISIVQMMSVIFAGGGGNTECKVWDLHASNDHF